METKTNVFNKKVKELKPATISNDLNRYMHENNLKEIPISTEYTTLNMEIATFNEYDKENFIITDSHYTDIIRTLEYLIGTNKILCGNFVSVVMKTWADWYRISDVVFTKKIACGSTLSHSLLDISNFEDYEEDYKTPVKMFIEKLNITEPLYATWTIDSGDYLVRSDKKTLPLTDYQKDYFKKSKDNLHDMQDSFYCCGHNFSKTLGTEQRTVVSLPPEINHNPRVSFIETELGVYVSEESAVNLDVEYIQKNLETSKYELLLDGDINKVCLELWLSFEHDDTIFSILESKNNSEIVEKFKAIAVKGKRNTTPVVSSIGMADTIISALMSAISETFYKKLGITRLNKIEQEAWLYLRNADMNGKTVGGGGVPLSSIPTEFKECVVDNEEFFARLTDIKYSTTGEQEFLAKDEGMSLERMLNYFYLSNKHKTKINRKLIDVEAIKFDISYGTLRGLQYGKKKSRLEPNDDFTDED